jgi:hypothetical protein
MSNGGASLSTLSGTIAAIRGPTVSGEIVDEGAG